MKGTQWDTLRAPKTDIIGRPTPSLPRPPWLPGRCLSRECGLTLRRCSTHSSFNTSFQELLACTNTSFQQLLRHCCTNTSFQQLLRRRRCERRSIRTSMRGSMTFSALQTFRKWRKVHKLHSGGVGGELLRPQSALETRYGHIWGCPKCPECTLGVTPVRTRLNTVLTPLSSNC